MMNESGPICLSFGQDCPGGRDTPGLSFPRKDGDLAWLCILAGESVRN